MTIICLDIVVGKLSTMPGVVAPDPVYVPGPVLTSLLYPIEVTEAFNAAAGDASGVVADDVIGSINVASDLIDGSLGVTIAYQQTSVQEQFDVSTDIVEGALEATIVYRQTAVTEQMDVSTDLVSGALVVQINYITHVDPATDEGFNVSTNIISGLLT